MIAAFIVGVVVGAFGVVLFAIAMVDKDERR